MATDSAERPTPEDISSSGSGSGSSMDETSCALATTFALVDAGSDRI
jgi:hypothetical protein